MLIGGDVNDQEGGGVKSHFVAAFPGGTWFSLLRFDIAFGFRFWFIFSWPLAWRTSSIGMHGMDGMDAYGMCWM